MLKKIVLATSLFFITTSTFAFSLAEKEKHQKIETEVASQVEFVNKICGSKIQASFDWATFSKEQLETIGIDGYSNEMLKGITKVCERSELAKQSVSEKIKNITYSYAQPRAIELKEGTLYLGIDFDAANDTKAVEEYLLNNL
ncbi:hypothetical protein GKR50_12955 [Providencia rustigianii]|uniref:hypothetical protein n=1 Tax=Providencia rustigianii TaxID=158850 RepID=UPI000F6D40D3|nr:hypothetical protein [Providencia rustigianii]MTC60917.1 hypothetical protein [Providencia rustigianii]VEH55331.1 Uncharacterised protein [Providencia rustigianii]